MKAIEIGRQRVPTVESGTPVAEVARLMQKHQASCLVVVAEASMKPLGVISERDLVLRALAPGADFVHMTAASIMSTPAIVCHADASLADIVQAMAGGGVAHLPLVDDERRLVGIVSATDVTAAVTELLGQLAKALATDALSDRPYA
ncbi:CBS domain-containing protein [Luteibacter flocculans]|uniref:CBS domain-containing protein n=1 Tax=Luteibacter flocculans TaxID=2780091 RepID=A0ABY4T5L0_9GAMM|nr:CBS domain-containing protein [Luteibacter flocculans]URL60198.1 CBS domain-containing protein [Luteibacter flocculans]